MKHKHYDMIVAKAANFDLILFVKLGDSWQITGSHDNQTINISSHYDYFLCLPQRKDACLRWLNGEDAQYKDDAGDWCDFDRGEPWSDTILWMLDEDEIRIKPRKEKRWIACNTENENVYGMFSSKIRCLAAWPELQIIEIEVEVQNA